MDNQKHKMQNFQAVSSNPTYWVNFKKAEVTFKSLNQLAKCINEETMRGRRQQNNTLLKITQTLFEIKAT